MPWLVQEREGKHCVYREGPDGEPVGEALGCHDSAEAAREQQQALYASEGKSAVKFVGESEVEIEGLLAPNYGPFGGKDLAGEFFSPKTDFVLEWFAENARPVCYHHGLDPQAKATVIGRMKKLTRDEAGLWMQAQLDQANDYYEAVKELIRQGKLGLSSGSLGHLVQVDGKSGEILRWPLIEGSLTPSPCNPAAKVDFASVKSHFEAVGTALSDEIKAKLDAEQRNALDDGDFAYIDGEGGRHLPIQDESHVRAALSRFNQTYFESDEAKERAWRKVMAAAHRMGIAVAEEKAFTVDGKAYLTLAGETWCYDGEWKALTTADGPLAEEDQLGGEPVAKEPAPVKMNPEMIREMAGEMGVEVSDQEIDFMLAEMDGVDDMEMAKEKIRGMLAEHRKAHVHGKMGKPMMMEMMAEMAAEMGMAMAKPEMEAMMAEMGDMTAMDEDEAKEKMQGMLARHKKPAGHEGEPGEHKASDLLAWLLDSDMQGIDATPLASHAEAIKMLTTSLQERTRDLRERRVKEGRVLSAGNRKRLGETLDLIRKACDDMQGLLDATAPQAKADPAKVRLRLAALRLYEKTF